MHIFVPLKIPTAMVKRSVKDLKSSFGALKKYVLLTEGWQGGGGEEVFRGVSSPRGPKPYHTVRVTLSYTFPRK